MTTMDEALSRAFRAKNPDLLHLIEPILGKAMLEQVKPIIEKQEYDRYARKPITIRGITYSCAHEASRELGVSTRTIRMHKANGTLDMLRKRW